MHRHTLHKSDFCDSEDNFSPAKLLKFHSDFDEMHPQSRFIISEPSLGICELLIFLNFPKRCQVANAFFQQMHINQLMHKADLGLSRRTCGCVCVLAVIMRSLSPSKSRGQGDCWQCGLIRTRGDTGLLSPGYLTLLLLNECFKASHEYHKSDIWTQGHLGGREREICSKDSRHKLLGDRKK